MNPFSKTYSTQAVQDAVPVDWRIVPFSLSVGIVKTTGGGTLSLTLEGTLDDVNDASITPAWFSIGSAITASGISVISQPIQAIRANIGSLSGTTVTMKLLMGESIN